MNRLARPLLFALLSGLALLVLSGPAHAQYRTGRRAAFPPNRMPGWDWWRTYPWSPYNYGRNPYNPIIYPYIQPYPVYQPYPAPYEYGAPAASPYDEPVWGAADAQQPVLVPHPSGEMKVAPKDAAVIRLYIPDRFGEVFFDGKKSSSVGTTRYYVTPDLDKQKDWQYVVKARFQKDGRTVTEEQTVQVSPGKTVQVDFR
jgi:uncharacterized protein (TIGR03000 family)